MKRCRYVCSFLLAVGLCVLVGPEAAIAQDEGTITGTVFDANTGEPLPGANVLVPGTDYGTAANASGSYTLEVEPGTYTVQASFVGYQSSTEEGIQVEEGQTVQLSFQLSPAERALEEVVVVGYGEQQREEVTGAVSQVSASAVEDVGASSASEALQGQASGVMVQRTGTPGEEPEVRIRGLNTLNSNDPLFVVDGVERDNLVGINTSDIQSVEVLKDASAASIYGSRASGGVVLITTKRGEPGGMRVDVNTSAGVKVPHRELDLLNTEQYVEVNTELRQNAGSTPPSRFSQEGFPGEFPETDWQDAITESTLFTNNNLAVSGGTEDVQYRASLGYLNEGGSLVETGYERYTFRINSDVDLGRLSFSESFSVTQGIDKVQRGDGFEGVLQMPPYIPVFNEDNLAGYDGVDQVDGADKPNPLRELEHGFNRSQDTQITGNITGELQILESLLLRSVFGVDVSWRKRRNVMPPFFEGDFHQQGFTSIQQVDTRRFQPVSTTTLNLNDFELGENHQLNGTAGFEIQNTEFRRVNKEGRNELTDLTEIGTVPRPAVTAGTGEDVLVSTFGRLSYSYAGRYQIEGSLRRDGYSRFGFDNKYGLFPSVSVGWNLGQEAFMSDAPFSTLRLRGSWGQTGNNNALDRYEFQSTIDTGADYNFGSEIVTAATIPSLANPNLEWEKSESLNVGVDFGFWEDAFTVSAEYYENTTDDILLEVPLPNSFGFSGDTRANTGTVVSDGVEFTASYQSRSTGDFSWSVDANFSTSTNEVESLGLGNPINTRSWGWGGSTASKRLDEGNPIFYWFGWKVDRLFQPDDFDSDGNLREGLPEHRATTAPGDIKFKDLNGDGVVNAEDQTNLGDPHPDFTFGLTGDVSWGPLDLSVFLQGMGGHQLAVAYWGFSRGMTRVWNHETVVLDRWTPDNQDTDVPRAVDGDPNNNSRISDRFIEDGDYLRLKRLTIGYEPEFVSRFDQVQNVRLYVRGEDLLTFTGYDGLDPEVANSGGGMANFGYDTGHFTHPRRFTVGLNFSF